MSVKNTLPEVIMVDDDPHSLKIMQELFERARVANPLRVFGSGESAIEYLRECCAHGFRPVRTICLALLDIRMPGVSGLDVLAWIRSQSPLHFLPVVMLTVSNEPEDVRRADDLGAHSYLLKFPLAETLAGLVRVAAQTVASA